MTPDRPPQQAPRACHGIPSGTGPAWPPQVTPAGPRVSHTIYTTHRERQPAWASRFSLIVRIWRFGRPLCGPLVGACGLGVRSKVRKSKILRSSYHGLLVPRGTKKGLEVCFIHPRSLGGHGRRISEFSMFELLTALPCPSPHAPTRGPHTEAARTAKYGL